MFECIWMYVCVCKHANIFIVSVVWTFFLLKCFVYLLLILCIWPATNPRFHLCIHLAIWSSICLTICLSVHLSKHLYVCLSLYPSIHLNIYLPIHLVPTYLSSNPPRLHADHYETWRTRRSGATGGRRQQWRGRRVPPPQCPNPPLVYLETRIVRSRHCIPGDFFIG